MELKCVVKVVLLGASGVGKSSIMKRYVQDTFDDYTDPTRGAAYMEKILLSRDHTKAIKLAIWDTAGQELYKSLAPFYYKDADAVLLVYDVTSMASFEALSYWHEEITKRRKTNCHITIVGNKSDCIDREAVSLSVAKAFAMERNASFALLSAKENNGINETFYNLAIHKHPDLDADFSIQQPTHEVIDANIVYPRNKATASVQLIHKIKSSRGCC